MKTTTLYRENKQTGQVEKISVESKYYKPSYDSEVDMPLPKRVLDTYRQLEANGKLGPNDCEGGKTFTKRLWEREAARYE